jgi:Fe-S cluster assembly protein SufD
MSKAAQQDHTILKDLLTYQTHLNGQSSLLDKIREQSAEKVKNTRFPTHKDEDWRFTNLKPITRGENFVPSHSEEPDYKKKELEQYFIPEAENTRLVFINGKFSENLSSVDDLPDGTVIGNLSELAADGHEIVSEHLNQYAEYEEDIFTYFNGSFFNDGSFVYIPEETKVEAPVHVLNFYTKSDQDYFTTPRTLVVADKFSKSTVIEEHIGLSDNRYLTVPVVELKLFEGANVKHLRIQRDSTNAIHISRPVAHVDKHSKYESYTITLGARLSRNDPKIVATDEEVDFTVDGLVLIDGDQIADTHSVMDHQFAHATSHQLHKCVINGEAHSIFNGKIYVRQGSQKIDSFQENRNLLLSRDGHVNTKPQLEIFADDVVCTHGATIGSFEDEELFYLKSRGLNEEKARELITYGFALETIENIEVESIHQLLLKEVEKFSKSHKKDRIEPEPVA